MRPTRRIGRTDSARPTIQSFCLAKTRTSTHVDQMVAVNPHRIQ